MRKNAFTLIELLVVIAIIAILAAILFPVFAQAKLAAKKTQGLAQMKQIGTSLQIYLADYDDGLPTWNACLAASQNGQPLPAECTTVGTFAAEVHWDAKLQPYVKNGNPELSQWAGLWQSPGAEYAPTAGRSIGMNQLLFWRIDMYTSAGSCLGPSTNAFSGCYSYFNSGEIEYPSRTMFVADSGKAGRYEPTYFLNGWAETWDTTYAAYKSYGFSTPWRYGGESANYVWLDTHAKVHRGDQIYPNPGHDKHLSDWSTADVGRTYCSAATYQAPTNSIRTLLIGKAVAAGVSCEGAN